MLRWENSFRADNGKVNPCSRYCLTQPWRFRKALIDPSNLHHVSHRRKTMISTSPGWGSGNRFFRSQGQTRIAEGPISETLDEEPTNLRPGTPSVRRLWCCPISVNPWVPLLAIVPAWHFQRGARMERSIPHVTRGRKSGTEVADQK